jgi:hypothetical protein
VLQNALRAAAEERERAAEEEHVRRRAMEATRRRAYWGPDAEQPSEAGAAAVVEDAPLRLALNGPADRAGRDVRQALLANPDLSYLPEALQWYYHPPASGSSSRPGAGPLPDKLYVVHSGCVAAQLMHHPADLDRRAHTN